jgi:Flp pilus assembly pilin Flp
MSLLAATERLSAPLDWCRRGWFSWILRSNFGRATLADRDRRIATIACASVLLAAFGAVYCPVLLFTLGPVLLGVAHVAADVRYLVLRRNLARWWQSTVWLGCLALIALRALEELRVVPRNARLEYSLAAAFIAVAPIAALRERGSLARAGVASLALGAALAAAWQHPGSARYVFLHAHNLIALVAWATVFRANKRCLLAPLALIGATTALLASGTLSQQTLGSPFALSFHLHVLTVAHWLAPFQNARLGLGVATAYLFLQGVHYSAWLSWIPQQEQPGRGTFTFRMTARSLFADFGAPGVAAVALAAGALLIGACFNVQRSQSLYLSLATFHGYLELALLAFFWVRGADLGAPGAVAGVKGGAQRPA